MARLVQNDVAASMIKVMIFGDPTAQICGDEYADAAHLGVSPPIFDEFGIDKSWKGVVLLKDKSKSKSKPFKAQLSYVGRLRGVRAWEWHVSAVRTL